MENGFRTVLRIMQESQQQFTSFACHAKFLHVPTQSVK